MTKEQIIKQIQDKISNLSEQRRKEKGEVAFKDDIIPLIAEMIELFIDKK